MALVVLLLVWLNTVACTVIPPAVGPSCPQMGFVEVDRAPSLENRPVLDGRRTIHVRRQPLTTTRDITDIELQDWYGDAQIRFRFTPVAANALHEATTDHSGMGLALMFNDEVLVNVIWEGTYGVPVEGSQVDIKKGTRRVRELMKSLPGCTAGSVRDETR